MSADIGEHLTQVLKTVQRNVFKCVVCDTKVEFADNVNQYPAFPCGGCGKVSWKVFSINDKVIYK